MKNLALLILAVVLSSCASHSSDSGNASKVTLVETIELHQETLNRVYKIPAVLQAKNRANLAFQLSGTVNQVFVKMGDLVVAEQPLMSLYNPNLDPALVTQLAQLESVKAQIDQARRDVRSLKELQKNNSTSRNAYEHKETELKNLLAQEKSIQAQIDQAEANQSESIITAPFNGVIVAVSMELGEFVPAGQPAVTINQTEVLESQINISEDLWQSVNTGDSIKVNSAGNSYIFDVSEKSFTANSMTQLFPITIEINDASDLSVGDSITVQFSKTYSDVYQLPLEAVVDDGINQPYIFQVVNGKATVLKIKPLYLMGDNLVFETEGSVEGSVIVKGQARVNQGSAVMNSDLQVAEEES